METKTAPVQETVNAAYIQTVMNNQRKFFLSGQTKKVEFRLQQLKALKNAVKKYEQEIYQALKADLGKPAFEAYASEIGFVLEEIEFTIRNLRTWVEPEYIATPLTQFLSTARVTYEPFGQTLIISPWNYPFQLCIVPLIGAIAAGNTAVLKPSEMASHTSALIARLISQTFAPDYITALEGGIETNQLLLAQKFDYIFFTGSPMVGKIVMRAAAEQLIPVTLELGGKSPCIVDENVNVEVAAARIMWGKLFNTGQTCIAPDYLLVHKSRTDALLKAMKSHIINCYGTDPQKSTDYGRIINLKHFDRIVGYLNDGTIYHGGRHDRSERYIEPTIIQNVSPDAPLMQEEIFGPILPVMEYNQVQDAIDFINSRQRPLALYVFTNRKSFESQILDNTHFGGGCINDTLVHLSSPELPFGGIGSSGMGSYHGKYSFEAFSHKRSILKKSIFPEIKLRYAPYKNKLSLLKKLMG